MGEGQAKRILLVEDDFDIGEALGELLREMGHEVLLAMNGAVALQALRGGRRFDVILLDLMMPVMDGYEFRARQLADPAVADVPCVVVSADTKANQRMAELRPKALLGKPVPLDRLTALIDGVERRG
jgi:CheY-like chemotaxis protein